MEEVGTMHFLVAIVLFNTKMHQNLAPKGFTRSRSFGDLGKSSHVSCLSKFSKGFFSETTGTISFKFPMLPPGKGGKKEYIFGLGHMTKMTAIHTHIMVKTFKIFSSRTTGPIALKLVCSIWGLSPVKFV